MSSGGEFFNEEVLEFATVLHKTGGSEALEAIIPHIKHPKNKAMAARSTSRITALSSFLSYTI